MTKPCRFRCLLCHFSRLALYFYTAVLWRAVLLGGDGGSPFAWTRSGRFPSPVVS